MNQTIWKYLDYWKFESLLTKGYHFRRADKFQDPFEGHFAWGNGIKKYMDSKLEERNSQTNPMPGYSYLLVKLQEYERKRKSVYVSCWQNDLYESEAMWRLYTEIQKNKYSKAIVLKSSVDNLKNYLSPPIKPSKLEIKPVEYLESYASEDYSDTSTSIFFKKRKCFTYENEVRAVFSYKRFTDSNENEENKFISSNISKYIDEIRISPFLGDDFIKEIKLLLEKHDLKIPVNKSEILMQPAVMITETLTSVTKGEPHLGDVVHKLIKPVDNETVIITERFDDIKKEYIVKLNKK